MPTVNFFKCAFITHCLTLKIAFLGLQVQGATFAGTAVNTFMYPKSFMALCLLLLLNACAGPRKTGLKNNNLEGQWQLSVFQPSQKKTLAEVFGTRVVELQFNKDSNIVSGTTGCNRFRGTYTADTSRLMFSQNLILTRMACPGYNEQLILSALNQVNRYSINEGELQLRQDDTILMIFAKKM
jgi:heat shock protein HslJ